MFGKYVCFIINFESEINDRRKKSIQLQFMYQYGLLTIRPLHAYYNTRPADCCIGSHNFHSLNFHDALNNHSMPYTEYIAIKYHLTWIIPLCKFHSDS